MSYAVAVAAKPAAREAVDVYTGPKLPVKESYFRKAFETPEMREEMAKFFKTILFRLDEKKVMAEMEKLLADPTKTDEQIYNELKAKVDSLQRWFSPILRIYSLVWVLKRGLGRQVQELMQGFDKSRFKDYLEVYDRRYAATIRWWTGAPLNGRVSAVCDSSAVGFGDRIQAGTLFYPYKQDIPLNDANCGNPLLEVNKTHKPISEQEMASNSVDLIGCLGGLHHIPEGRTGPFVTSLHRVLRPGGVFLLRDHNVTDQGLFAIAATVHSFVNIVDKQDWAIEDAEVRRFFSMAGWQNILEKNGFSRMSPKCLVLKDDPTANGMAIFAKVPQNIDELRQAMTYHTNTTRPKGGTRATWIEWGNVRSAKEYAEFVQNHHAFAYDYIGDLRQHWQHFWNYLVENKRDKEVGIREMLFSGDMAMNLFILTTATVQLGLSAVVNAPLQVFARWRHGPHWRNVVNLTNYEKYEARVQKEYSTSIDETPFYQFPYLSKIGPLWKVIWQGNEGFLTKIGSSFSALISTISYLASAAISWPIRKIYTSPVALEPDRITVLIKDYYYRMNTISQQFPQITEIFRLNDGHVWLSVPRYRPFTKICKAMADKEIEILEIGGRKEISMDVVSKTWFSEPKDKVREIYRQPGLHDRSIRYITYQVQLTALSKLLRQMDDKNIEYIHE